METADEVFVERVDAALCSVDDDDPLRVEDALLSRPDMLLLEWVLEMGVLEPCEKGSAECG